MDQPSIYDKHYITAPPAERQGLDFDVGVVYGFVFGGASHNLTIS